MTDLRVRLQTTPYGLLRVVPPADDVTYLPVGGAPRPHPIWEQENLALYLSAGHGPDGELVIDLLIVERPPDGGAPAAAVAA